MKVIPQFSLVGFTIPKAILDSHCKQYRLTNTLISPAPIYNIGTLIQLDPIAIDSMINGLIQTLVSNSKVNKVLNSWYPSKEVVANIRICMLEEMYMINEWINFCKKESFVTPNAYPNFISHRLTVGSARIIDYHFRSIQSWQLGYAGNVFLTTGVQDFAAVIDTLCRQYGISKDNWNNIDQEGRIYLSLKTQQFFDLVKESEPDFLYERWDFDTTLSNKINDPLFCSGIDQTSNKTIKLVLEDSLIHSSYDDAFNVIYNPIIDSTNQNLNVYNNSLFSKYTVAYNYQSYCRDFIKIWTGITSNVIAFHTDPAIAYDYPKYINPSGGNGGSKPGPSFTKSNNGKSKPKFINPTSQIEVEFNSPEFNKDYQEIISEISSDLTDEIYNIAGVPMAPDTTIPSMADFAKNRAKIYGTKVWEKVLDLAKREATNFALSKLKGYVTAKPSSGLRLTYK